MTSNILPVMEDTEMAVDEDEEGEEEEEGMKNMAESPSPLYRPSPLSWEERTISFSLKARDSEEVMLQRFLQKGILFFMF